ncbi:MAG: nucleotidyltransferase, partial [Chloroflexi bacterium]|nr:nucleotidyltransferase [Chloroflexota bacterium]
METKERILSLLQKHSEQMKALGVRKLGLFGSFVRGEQNEISDI